MMINRQPLIYPPPPPLFYCCHYVLAELPYCFISPRLAERDQLRELLQSLLKKVYPCHLPRLLTLTSWAASPLRPLTVPCPPLTPATPSWWAPLTPCSPCRPPPPSETASSPQCSARLPSWSVNCPPPACLPQLENMKTSN